MKSVVSRKPLVKRLYSKYSLMSELEMEKPDYMTTIKLHSSVRKRLAKHATKDQTYENLIVELLDKIEAVSYTHLTLPTICSV